MQLQAPVIGVSIRRGLAADWGLAGRLVRSAVDLGAALIDFRDSLSSERLRAAVLRELAPDVGVVLRVGSFYPTFENVIREVRELFSALGRPIDVVEFKRPVLIVSLQEVLRAIMYSISEGYALGFSIIGAWPGDVGLIERKGMKGLLRYLKLDVNAVRGLGAARRVNFRLFSSSALDGGRILKAGPFSFARKRRISALKRVAAEKGVKPEQVALAWLKQKGVSAAPAVSSVEHVREAIEANEIPLSSDDMKALG